MTNNVTEFPSSSQRDLVAEMKGPQQSGHSVIIDGRLVPNLVMFDRGETIEFVLDGRFIYGFPRDLAWLAASFAFSAMAIGAGFAHPAHMHFTQRPFASEVSQIGGV